MNAWPSICTAQCPKTAPETFPHAQRTHSQSTVSVKGLEKTEWRLMCQVNSEEKYLCHWRSNKIFGVIKSLSSLFDKVEKKNPKNQKKPNKQKGRKPKMNSCLKKNHLFFYPVQAFLWKVFYIFLWNVVHYSKQFLCLPRFIMIAGYLRNYRWRQNFMCKHLYSAIMANKRKTLHTNVERTFGKAQLSSRPSSKK